MRCLSCGGPLEFAGGGAHARCTQCLALYSVANGALTPVIVQAPGGGNNPEFNAIFAQQLGFAPRPAPAQGGRPEATFAVGGVGVRVRGPDIEGAVKSGIQGLVIWGIISGVVLIIGAVVVIFVVMKTKSAVDQSMGAANEAIAKGNLASGVTAMSWDGKAPFSCTGSQKMKAKGITANIAGGTAISATGACEVELDDVTITATLPIEAMGGAKIIINGGSLKGTPNAISAAGAANVTMKGTKVDGKVDKKGGATIAGP